MKKTYKLEELDCANCAAKMEAAIARIEGVKSVRVDFIMQKLTLEAEDGAFDEILKKAVRVISRTEPDCRVVI